VHVFSRYTGSLELWIKGAIKRFVVVVVVIVVVIVDVVIVM